ncbi:MAG: hemolysin family protein [Bacilli bacterium]
MDPLSWLYLFLSIIMIILSFFFSLAETVYSSVDRYKMQVLSDQGNKGASLVIRILDHFDSTLITVLIGNNAVAVCLSVFSTSLFLTWFHNTIDDGLVSLIASIIITIIVYIFAETFPKQIAKKIPNKLATKVVYPLVFFMILFFPFTMTFLGISILAKKFFKGKEEPELTEDDFNSIIEKNESEGLLEDNETDIIQNSFDFTDTSVKEVLTPKEKMYEIDLKGLTNSKLISYILHTNYSRIPMYYEKKENIIGILIVKKYLASYLKDPHVSVQAAMEKPYIVSPSIMMDDVLDGFRTHHTQIALVYSEKKLLGMITSEDVLEELVGPLNEKPSSVPEVR